MCVGKAPIVTKLISSSLASKEAISWSHYSLLARARKIKDYGDGLTKGMAALVEKAMKNGLKSKNDGIEDGGKPPKWFMIHAISNEQPMEQVGGEKVFVSKFGKNHPSQFSSPQESGPRPTTDDRSTLPSPPKEIHTIWYQISFVVDSFPSWTPMWSMIPSYFLVLFVGNFLVKKVESYLCSLIEDLLDKSIRGTIEAYSHMIPSFETFVITFKGTSPFKNYILSVKWYTLLYYLPFKEFLQKFVCEEKFGKSWDFENNQSYTFFDEFLDFMSKSTWKKGLSNLVLDNLFIFNSILGLYVDNILKISLGFTSPCELKMRFHYVAIHESLLKDLENESLNFHVPFKEMKSYIMGIHGWVFGFEKDDSFQFCYLFKDCGFKVCFKAFLTTMFFKCCFSNS
ncbi:hypothetical protein M9H77_34418 [Catharanthus roseus]|uniref:Uncharacterized protein n=1 Tax=Catharanthus roseus TaxID=4058 RepID=A0ACB9ZN04_CATRO|nr:hypothetical protein M9H77_34418 [Catharanthus roseus]